MRSVQAVKPLLTTVKVMPIPEAVVLPMHSNLRDDSGVFNPGAQVLSGAKTMLDELLRWSGALKPLRAR